MKKNVDSGTASRLRPLSVAGACLLSLSLMGAVGCSSPAASSGSASGASTEPVTMTMEYSDGGDLYDHESILVDDASLIAEGAEFVNGFDAENTYIYKGYVHGDNAHYSMYSLYTELITDGDGLLTAVNLTSGNDTWSNRWGEMGANPQINGALPEGVSFSYTEKDGTFTPELTVETGTEADKAGHSISAIYLYNVKDDLTTTGSDVEGRRGTTHFDYDATISLDAAIVDDDDDDDEEEAAGGRGGSSESSERSGSGERSGGGERSGSSEGGHGDKGGNSEGGHGDKGGSSDATASADATAAEPAGVSYDAATGAITIDADDYNLIQIQYKFGTETLFNEFIAVDDNENAQKYVEANFPATDLEVVDTLESTGVTNRTKWAYSMLSLMAQREFASWGSTFEDVSLYTGGNDGEIGDIDTISGATKTSVPFQSALNQAIEAGYVTGIADPVEVTIDAGTASTDGIDASATPQDQTTVTVNEDGLYEITFEFPAGVNEMNGADGGQHAIAPNAVDIYALGDEDLGTLGVWNLGKGTTDYAPLATYEDSSKAPGDVDDAYVTYVSDWDYPYLPTLTVKDPSITHVVIHYTIGHESLGIAYDLKAMAQAHEVEEMIEALNVNDAAAVADALAAYEDLTYDVRGTVSNASKLLEAANK